MDGTVAVNEPSTQAVTDRSISSPQVTPLPEDIPGADVSEPFEQHTVSALHWWLLCRGIKVPSS